MERRKSSFWEYDHSVDVPESTWAMQHQDRFGEQRLEEAESNSVIQNCYYYTQVYKEVKELVATFTFRYRSFDVLQTSGIAPCERKDGESSTSNAPKEVIVLNEDGDADGSDHPQPATVEPEVDVPMRQESVEPQQEPTLAQALTPLIPRGSPEPEESTSGDLPNMERSPEDNFAAGDCPTRDSSKPSLNPATSGQVPELSSRAPLMNPLKRAASEIDAEEGINEDKIKSDPDMDSVKARKVAILAELAQIERLQDMQRESGLSSQKRVKREPSASVMFFKPGEVIDLT